MTGPNWDDLVRRVAELEVENAHLRGLLGLAGSAVVEPVERWDPTLFPAASAATRAVSRRSSPDEKIGLFRDLFAGRDDVYAVRWENQRTGKAGWSPAVRGGWSNSRRPDRELLPLNDGAVSGHLEGQIHAGLYPLGRDDTCRLLVCDFDGTGWVLDAQAYLNAACVAGVPAALECSRSGDGGHVWVFFEAPVAASVARRIGAYLIREAMTVRAELDLASYDRLFPSQDFLPRKGFGNLIALPLQGECRKRGTTVFLDPATLVPFPDQWEFLSSLARLSRQAAVSMAETLGDVAAGPEMTTYRRPVRGTAPAVPTVIKASAGAMLEIDRIGVPPSLLAALKHAASLPNPDFYEKERNRFWTGNTPRFIRCYRETIDKILLPRGVRSRAETITLEAGSRLEVSNRHPVVEPVEFKLRAVLRPDQAEAVEVLHTHDLGVLVAPPGAGKTVMACAVIAHRRAPTLVIVDRQPLIDQWRDRLQTHLCLDHKEVGHLAGTRKPSGIVDLAMAQSLGRRDDLADLANRSGFVVVDECHHVPAVTFERAVRQIPARHWLGLTATPIRRDGLQAMITMYCGPIRHRMAGPPDAQLLHREVVVHETAHAAVSGAHIQETFRGLVTDGRTRWICDDIAASSAADRNNLVLTRWAEHLDLIVANLRERGMSPLVLKGGMGKKARRAVLDELERPFATGLVLVATASLLGEGFDCPALDTVFLAFPIRFKGAIIQYVGRILRPTPDKTRVIVHDYVDVEVPVLARMYSERVRGYASLGFQAPKRLPGLQFAARPASRSAG